MKQVTHIKPKLALTTQRPRRPTARAASKARLAIASPLSASLLVVGLIGCIQEPAGSTGIGTAQALAAIEQRSDLDLVGYWSFDSSDTVGDDRSGSRNPAQISNATWTGDGRSGGALYFNGSDSIATIADGAWNAGNPVTYNLWFKSQGPRVGYLLDHEFSTKTAGAFALDASGARFRAYDATRKVRDFSLDPVPTDTWTMLTVAVDGSTLRLYRNGKPIGSTSRKLPRRAGALHIGASAGGGNSFRGWIDEVTVFGRALNDAQVAEIHATYPPPSTAGTGGTGGNDPDLLGHWPFEDGSAADVSEHTDTGEVVGATLATGRFGNGLYFDGKSHVRIPDGPWNRAAPVTYNIWLKPDGDGGGFVFNRQWVWQAPGTFALGTDKTLTFDAIDAKGAEISYSDHAANSRLWTMVTMVFTQDEVRLYKNGVRWTTLKTDGMPTPGGALYLGASDDVKWGFFKGWIDDLSIFGRALSDQEIQKLPGWAASTCGAPDETCCNPVDEDPGTQCHSGRLCNFATNLCTFLDEDADYIGDSFEDALAAKVFPVMMMRCSEYEGVPLGSKGQFYGSDEGPGSAGRLPFVAHIYQDARIPECARSGGCIEMRYGMAYNWDLGDDVFGDGHSGDTEMVSLLLASFFPWSEAHGSVDRWRVLKAYTGSHACSSGDSSAFGSYGPLAGPVIWVAEGKNASYLSKESCNDGGPPLLTTDDCNESTCQVDWVGATSRLQNAYEFGRPYEAFIPRWNYSTSYMGRPDNNIIPRPSSDPNVAPSGAYDVWGSESFGGAGTYCRHMSRYLDWAEEEQVCTAHPDCP